MRTSTLPMGIHTMTLHDTLAAPHRCMKELGIDPSTVSASNLIRQHGKALTEAFANPGGPFTVEKGEGGQSVVQSRDSDIPLPAGFRELALPLARQYPDQALSLLIAAMPHTQDEDTQREILKACACALSRYELFSSHDYTSYALGLAQRYPQHVLALLDAVDPELLETHERQQWREARAAVSQALAVPPAITTRIATTTTTSTLHATPENPLLTAILGCNLAATRALLETGAHLNPVDEQGSTALHIAAANGFTEGVELLLAHKADVHAQTDSRMTPLHSACKGGHREVARMLLHAGADVHACTDVGDTALMFAAASNVDPGLVTLLLMKGAQVQPSDPLGRTALHRACQKGLQENVEILLEAGADTRVKDRQGRTPLDMVQGGPERPPIADLLKRHSAKASL